jgi:hypothetical protein
MLLLPALPALIQLKIAEFFEAGKLAKKSAHAAIPGLSCLAKAKTAPM